MVGIVRLALRRPYTFIVMAMLIMIFGVASAFRTPTDIFPDINIPVVSVVFSYTGLPPAHHQRERHRAHRIAVDSRLRDHQDLLPAHREH
jgi:Cu/Ag efflux pump CusA